MANEWWERGQAMKAGCERERRARHEGGADQRRDEEQHPCRRLVVSCRACLGLYAGVYVDEARTFAAQARERTLCGHAQDGIR